jgi:hypothetical protein
LQAVNLPRLDDGNGEPLPRDLPDGLRDRTSWMKKRIRKLMNDAAYLAEEFGVEDVDQATVRKMRQMRDEAAMLKHMRLEKLSDIQYYQTHPPTHHAAEAWGAEPGEPRPQFPRALRRTLVAMGVDEAEADALIDTGEGAGGSGWRDWRERGRGRGREPRHRWVPGQGWERNGDDWRSWGQERIGPDWTDWYSTRQVIARC